MVFDRKYFAAEWGSLISYQNKILLVSSNKQTTTNQWGGGGDNLQQLVLKSA